MIPNVFISSTIEDLHYLREGLRDAVVQLAYRPVMSDYGEVGYLHPETAAESCYRSVKECQIAVIIVGSRYGIASPTDGISVTHKEFRTARKEGIPLIALVESEVMSFKKVYQANKDQKELTHFPRMDNPVQTFAFLDEIANADAFNGLITFKNVAEAANSLKRQIADLVGQSLAKIFSPMRSEIKDVLAEIKTLRQELGSTQNIDTKFLQIIRYLIDENRAKGFRYLIEHTIGPIDKAVQFVIKAGSFDDFLKEAGWKPVVSDSAEIFPSPENKHESLGAMSFIVPSTENPLGFERADFSIRNDRTIEMNPPAHSYFDSNYHALKREVGN